MSEANIMLGNQLTVGKVILNPEEIKGVGGWYNPYLHIPIKMQLYTREKEEQIALIRLTASLYLTENQDITKQFGAKVSYDFIYNLPNRSIIGSAPSEGGAQLLFSLTHEQIQQLDELRHKPNSNLYLHLEPIIVRVRQTVQGSLTLGDQRVGIGLQSDFTYPWLATIGTLRIETVKMKWAENIFPDIGYDRYRLVEVSLPTSNTLVPEQAIEYFKNAKKSYDEGNNQECLRVCRLALEEIKKHLKIQDHKLVTAVTKILGWPDQPELTEQAKFLNNTWLGLYTLANAANHTPSNLSLLP
ncbi:MAG: hypothetical protein ACJ788_18230, partial [Ktedonobacteraceae bacterium]